MMFCVSVCVCFFFFFFKQKTAYEMRISDWSSDVCSSDLLYLALCSKLIQRVGEVAGRNAVSLWRIVALRPRWRGAGDRKSVVSGKSVSVRVDLGGRRIIKKKKMTYIHAHKCLTRQRLLDKYRLTNKLHQRPKNNI